MQRLILASGSETRLSLLRSAGVRVEPKRVRIDEPSIRDSLRAEAASGRDIADHLAETKARKASQKTPDATVVGCDQVLEFQEDILGKAQSPDALKATLNALNGKRHKLYSAAVICENSHPVWRFVGTATLHMRRCDPGYLDAYVDRNWDTVRHCVGGYKLEEEGIRLFHRIDGDYFTILGIPLIELLAYLTNKGLIEG